MRKPLALLLALVLGLGAASGAGATGFSANASGTTGSDFLNLGVGARGAALGGAFLTVVDDANAVYWNPAALTNVKTTSLTAMHNAYIAGIRSEFVGVAQRVDVDWVLGGGVHYVNSGAINQTDVSGNVIGTFTPSDYLFMVSAGRSVLDLSDRDGDVSVGLTVKGFSSQIVDRASGWAFDVGVLVSRNLPVPMHLGVAVQNIGGGQKFDQIRENLPFNLKFGASATVLPGLLVSVDATAPRGGKLRGQAGVELSGGLSEDLVGAVRGGIDSTVYRDQPGFSGFSMGAGLTVTYLTLDYAVVPFGYLGTAHRFSVSFKF